MNQAQRFFFSLSMWRGFFILLSSVGFLSFLSGQVTDGQEITEGNIVVQLDKIINRPTYTTVGHPLFVETAGDNSGRLFLPEKAGRIRVWNNGLYSTFLDIQAESLISGSRGLLGMAIHPDYADSNSPGFRKLYTFHSAESNSGIPDFTGPGTVTHHNVVTEWQVDASDPNQVDMSTRRELFREAHTHAAHSGGMLEFDPDGYLYASIGTPANGGLDGQATNSVFGTILRIDPLHPSLTTGSADATSGNGQYRVPASNPFVGDTTGIDEIYAYGLRNPYRFSFDPDSGLIFAGDVGAGTREEVDVIQNGDNLGWPYWEGTSPGLHTLPDPPPVVVEPIAEYSHADGISVIGGYVYRGSIPELQGKYIFADFQAVPGAFGSAPGRLFWLDPFDEAGDLKDPADIQIHEFLYSDPTCAQFDYQDPCQFDQTVYSLGIDDDGELYSIGTRGSRTILYKFASAWKSGISGPADFNMDGIVNPTDFSILAGNWLTPGGPSTGDANNDGFVDPVDFTILAGNWLVSVGSVSSGAVPEPSSLLLALLATTALLGTLWRRSFAASND